MSERCWIVTAADGQADRPLHTDEDCHKLQAAENYRETTREKHPDRDVCLYCSGEGDVYRVGSGGPHELLKKRGAT